MKSEIIAKLIRKLGGDPTGATNKNQLLDKLCECEIGGGGNVLCVPFTNTGNTWSTTANHQEVVDAIRSGVFVFGANHKSTSNGSSETAYIATSCSYDSMDEWWIITFNRVAGSGAFTRLEWYPNGTINALREIITMRE